MKFAIFACLLSLAVAHSIDYKPGGGYSAPAPRRNLNEQYQTQSDGGYLSPDSLSRHDFKEEIAILRDDRNLGDGGSFTADIETENGIYESRSGSRLDDVEYNPIGQQGQISFTFPNGEEFSLKFVADENGYQPESSHLPVAPEFPHPIPQFVLDQIEKAAREDEVKSAEERVSAPSRAYSSRF